MAVPALHALARDAHAEARAFAYSGVLSLAVLGAFALATMRRPVRLQARAHLLTLVGIFALLPVMAATPLTQIVPEAPFLDLWFEMVAALTTTGGSLFAPDALSPSVHLWRAFVAWQGGLIVWIAAVALLAPLRLGGFEVTWSMGDTRATPLNTPYARTDDAARLARYTGALVPLYAGLTAILWSALAATGQGGTEAAIHAMSTLSTSGITGDGPPPGPLGEVAIFAFLFFAVSRQTFAADLHRGQVARLAADRELRMALAIVGAVTLVLFLRHFVGAFGLRGGDDDLIRGATALWGAAFTTLSFLTTTGFEGTGWDGARAWSGLENPAVLLVGLAIMGGGVATTAGGVKLLRAYALYAHGRREMGLLVHPHSVGSHSPDAARIPARGVQSAWVFFMLFATSLAVTTLALGLAGLDLRAALVLATATLTTCGPLAAVALEGGAGAVSDPAKAILAAAMVVGRLETLAIVALLNPDFWRR